MDSQRIDFRILGTIEVAGARGLRPIGGPKQRAVLAHLLLRSGAVVTAEQLIEAVWDGAPPTAARGSLQAYVSNLRRAIGSERIEGRSGGYVLHVDPDDVDARRFVALVDRAAATSPARPTERAALLADALALWRGPALADLADQHAFRAEAVALDERRATAREDWISAQLAIGERAVVVSTIEPLLDEDPLRERLWELLIAALYLDGRQADALRAYERARTMLAHELGIDPSPRLVRVHEMVLRQDLSLEALHPPLRGYRLLDRVHESGDTSRWRARQPGVDREVQIEVTGPPLANDPAFVRRFDADARAVAALRHPHIVAPLDWWREPDAAYLVFPSLPAASLAARLQEGHVDATTAGRVMAQVRDAVGAAHHRGLAHGALGPDVVVLDDAGTARVVWSGIGRVAWDGDATAADDDAVARLASGLGSDHAPVAANGGAERPGPNPYKGLRAFDDVDAPDFFGRAGPVAHLVERLTAGDRFVAVVGPSGAGKSSLVRAGLIPALRDGAIRGSARWATVVVVPGVAPFEDLAAALLAVARERSPNLAARLAAGGTALADTVEQLLDDDAELLLVIDQLEELFVLVGEHQRETFIESLLCALDRVDRRLRLVVTLRADFFDRPLRHGTLGQLLAAHTVVLPPMTPAEVALAVTGPAERAGAEVEPALVAQIVRDVADRPGALPLLQYALTEMYDRDGRLTIDGYHALGGLAGALAGRAEQVLADLDAAGRDAARELFLRLVVVGEGSGDLRRRCPRAELVALLRDGAAMDRAITAFGAARLLTFDRDPETRAPTVEVAHEALLTQWGRLRSWISTARDELVLRRRLASATHEWLAAGRDQSFLATGHRLDRFGELAAATAAITSDERAYLDASFAQRQRVEDEQAARRAAQDRARRRARRRRRALLVAGAVMLASVLTLSAFAVQQRTIAARQARTAAARQLASASTAALGVDTQRGLLLAIEAVERTRSVDGTAVPAAEDALRQAVWSSRLLATIDGAVGPVAWSPAGDVVVTGSADAPGAVQLRDATSFEVTRELEAHDGAVTGVAFSRDGARLATSGDDGTIKVWRTDTATRTHEVALPGDVVVAPAFSTDGERLTAVMPGEEVVAVIDADRGVVTDEIATRGRPQSAAMTEDATLLYQSLDGTERLVVSYSLPEDRIVFSTTPDAGRAGLALSPDGHWLATSGTLMRASTGVPVTGFEVAPGITPAWSDDGRRFVAGGAAGTAVVRELTDEGELRERAKLVAPTEGAVVQAAALAPDGTAALTVDDGGTVHAWDTSDGARPEVVSLPADSNDRTWPGIAWAPDGSHLAVSAGDGDVAIWRTDTWTTARTLAHGRRAAVNSIGWSPDGALIATVGRRKAKAWDARTGRLVFDVPYAWQWADVVWTPDGRHLAVMAGQLAEIVDRAGRRVVRVPPAGGEIWGASFNGDGTLLALAVNDGEGLVDVWDWRSAELVASVDISLADPAVGPTANGALVSSVSFDQTDDRFVVIGDIGARVAGVGDDQLGALLIGDADAFNDVTFAPDGRRVASAGSDGIVRLWDPDTGDELVTLRGHTGAVDQVRFSPDGRWLASASHVDGVRVWALRTGDLLDIARSKVTRRLTPAECAQYVPDEPCP